MGMRYAVRGKQLRLHACGPYRRRVCHRVCHLVVHDQVVFPDFRLSVLSMTVPLYNVS